MRGERETAERERSRREGKKKNKRRRSFGSRPLCVDATEQHGRRQLRDAERPRTRWRGVTTTTSSGAVRQDA
ncbi:hypothetical protein Scep_017086 [Stephania cephalantha]|uniref:Uncharacterized protein n=1 Tax=Stephania cephalantha TaxID=152367 RepID=A0AAP0INV9_9MAGN